MAKREYLTAPLPSEKMPAGIPYILTNEAAERFAFYGMSSILVVFMTQNLMGANGVLRVMTDESARKWFHLFTGAVYFMAIVGAVISDRWFGKFKTILWFSLVYCAGFFVMAIDHTRLGLTAGLILIAMGSGIIKPCVSANVGDQFGPSNKHLIQRVYSWFYFSINVGAAVSMWFCPILLEKWGPMVGFGVPAISMVIATTAYWLGRRSLVHIPPSGAKVWNEMFEREQRGNLARIGCIFLFVSMFFALYYQSQSAWVLQAEKMNLKWLGITWLPAQMQAANSVLVLVMIPAFAYGVYPALSRIWPMSQLRKIGIGLFVTAGSFLVPIWIETQIQQGGQPSIGWQFFAYIFLTAAEIMVSVTALEFAYTQAPNKMKSIIQAINLLSIALGNIFAFLVNLAIENADGTTKLPGASYYWFFAIAMLVTSFLYIPVAMRYPVKEYIQDEAPQEG
ncbi:MAG: POT family MFS transporter [Phycisphaerae bacterium]|nr:POT family MFS transporter [Phycisphaerae bacterium]